MRQQTKKVTECGSKYGNNPRPNNFEAFPAIVSESQAKFPYGVICQDRHSTVLWASPILSRAYLPQKKLLRLLWQWDQSFTCHIG
jgi:hypothetical protein